MAEAQVNVQGLLWAGSLRALQVRRKRLRQGVRSRLRRCQLSNPLACWRLEVVREEIPERERDGPSRAGGGGCGLQYEHVFAQNRKQSSSAP